MKKCMRSGMYLLLSAVMLCTYMQSNGSSYSSLNSAFEKAKRGALFQAQAVDDLSVQACPEKFVCQCHLVMAVDKAINEGKTPNYAQIMKDAHGACSASVTNALKLAVGAAGSDDATFLKKLYDTSLIIKDVTPPDALIQEGRFTTHNLGSYLQKAIKENKLFEPGLQNVIVTDIRSEGGAATLELFFLKNPVTGQEWIIKGIPSPKKEAFALSIVAQTAELASIIQPNSKPGFPILSLPISYLGYTLGSKKGVFAIMMKASGNELFKYMKDYVALPNDATKDALREGYRLIGQTLGNFHREYRRNSSNNPILAPTYTHGDFHARNVFVDVQKQLVYWIDNERIGQTIFQPNAPTTDWYYLLFLTFKPFLAAKLFKDVSLTEQRKVAWVQDFYPAFLHAYLDAFGAAHKQRAAQEMKDMLVRGNNQFHDDVILRETTALLDGIIAGKQRETVQEELIAPAEPIVPDIVLDEIADVDTEANDIPQTAAPIEQAPQQPIPAPRPRVRQRGSLSVF